MHVGFLFGPVGLLADASMVANWKITFPIFLSPDSWQAIGVLTSQRWGLRWRTFEPGCCAGCCAGCCPDCGGEVSQRCCAGGCAGCCAACCALVPTLEPSVPTFGNWKFFAMVTYGSQVGMHEFQLWEPAVACNGNLWFPGWEPGVPISGNRQFLAMVTCGSHVGNREFQPLGPGTSLP